MIVKCAGLKRDGTPCTATVEPPQVYCWWHNPAHAEERRRNAAKAGRAKPNRDIADIKAQLQAMADKVLAGTLDRSDAAVAGQLLNIKLRALETERRWKETGELEERIELLENGRGA